MLPSFHSRKVLGAGQCLGVISGDGSGKADVFILTFLVQWYYKASGHCPSALALVCSNRARDAAQKSSKVFLCRYRNLWNLPGNAEQSRSIWKLSPNQHTLVGGDPIWKSLLHCEATVSSCCCFITKIAEHIHHWDTFILKNGQMLFAATPLAHFPKVKMVVHSANVLLE